MSSTNEQAAKKLHQAMIEEPENTLFTEPELRKIAEVESAADLMVIVQVLLNQSLVKLVKQNGELRFQAVEIQEAAKRANMTSDESIIYSYIEASGREGIWTKTIKARTNLHQHVVLRCLKSLEGQRFIKSVKSVKFPTRKIYMLYHLTPSIEVTGGPWFTDGELDSEFVDSLLTIVWRFVTNKTFPNIFNDDANLKKNQLYAANYKNYSTLEEILEFITRSQVTSEELIENDIRSLCQVLVYDDKLEKLNLDCYRSTYQSVVDLKEERLDEGFSIFDAASYTAPSQEEDTENVYFDEYVL
ncbi:DNA-directed RNA polymerase III subunit [Wickerhamomyces ciferrii]|uniref:DNA-directed RNA polymerase III subunit RPC6 n=1 Tax=Wickerhamomyces ciferrii (strain ATCC 14091 / BCRC 22168 / CBS 111 / JCM 3599 / NBRC 0793 / NRRL Y-1031 F-60-10) TaxID=1206466 RepID=K0KIR9_WICCF|nr:DNA-directed RNA polymerase III subunit [Wickerhamomyces ciferrii]CCH42067.1 DNA-directed RNA polymerase III subunit [Wickerhamomyces ciferrii]